jgi:hypothetical protein
MVSSYSSRRGAIRLVALRHVLRRTRVRAPPGILRRGSSLVIGFVQRFLERRAPGNWLVRTVRVACYGERLPPYRGGIQMVELRHRMFL